ncbi:hypothetical protein [Fuchsiella alkaliacetigena]|uniref:hypothetical protein n=1 Tax=Fuchsiella alkaliacetigena TaxID=957042 RepID=UPI00200A974F|nr:hypothetical protein [Fuchsiella alkaliacetigena]MCK8823594.1 hypothetical protein [Fuchsiella alkaliacetigena]
MSSPATKEEVANFLKRVEKAINDPDWKFQFIPRDKNLNSLNKYGLSIKHIKFSLKRLEVRDYYRGPTKDRSSNFSGDFWEFGKEIIEGVEFYIKLKIKGKHLLCKCLSFHEAEYKINYPYKE